MADMQEKQNFIWPKIVDAKSATEAVNTGFWAAVIVASITAIFATWAIVSGSGVGPIDGWAYLDAIFFGIIAWRIKRYSRAFAVIGLLLFIVEKALLAQTQGAAGWPLAIIMLIMFITGVRGVFAYHKYSSQSEETPGA